MEGTGCLHKGPGASRPLRMLVDEGLGSRHTSGQADPTAFSGTKDDALAGNTQAVCTRTQVGDTRVHTREGRALPPTGDPRRGSPWEPPEGRAPHPELGSWRRNDERLCLGPPLGGPGSPRGEVGADPAWAVLSASSGRGHRRFRQVGWVIPSRRWSVQDGGVGLAPGPAAGSLPSCRRPPCPASSLEQRGPSVCLLVRTLSLLGPS